MNPVHDLFVGLRRLRHRYGPRPPRAAIQGLEDCIREGLQETHP